MKHFTWIWAILAILMIVFYAFNFTNMIHSPIYRLIPIEYVFSLDFLGVSSWYLVSYAIENIHTAWLKIFSIALCLLFVIFPLYINLRVLF